MQELEEIEETYFESELVIEGEFASEATMVEWGFTELPSCHHLFFLHPQIFCRLMDLRKRIAAIKRYCMDNPAKFMRLYRTVMFRLTG